MSTTAVHVTDDPAIAAFVFGTVALAGQNCTRACVFTMVDMLDPRTEKETFVMVKPKVACGCKTNAIA